MSMKFNNFGLIIKMFLVFLIGSVLLVVKMNCFTGVLSDMPVNWQISFQNPATPVMEGIIWLHNYILLFLIVVVVVVFWFLGRSLYLFNEHHNSIAMEFNHDPVIEAIWTIAPAFVLIAIAIPSFSLLYSIDEVIAPTLTVKIIGHQWYWSYELDSISRYDVMYDYVKRDYIPGLDLYDVQRWEGEKVTAYFLERVAKWKKALDRLFIHKVVTKVIWTSNGLSMGHLSFLTKASTIVWTDARYRSLMLIADPAQRVGVTEPPIMLRTTFYSILEPISHSYSIISTVKWLSPSVHFDSYMVSDADLKLGDLRLFEVDNRLVLPVKVHIRLLVTSTDVIHSWAVPSFGIKVDAIPGRLNQASLYIKRDGYFYGQCSELCGVNHAFMPINVQSVDYNTFIHWIRINSNVTKLDDLINSNWQVWVADVDASTKVITYKFPKLGHRDHLFYHIIHRSNAK